MALGLLSPIKVLKPTEDHVDRISRMADDKVKRIAKVIASGCYAELVDKSELTNDEYVERYWPLFEQAAINAIAELETA